jgi:hypothetical protein
MKTEIPPFILPVAMKEAVERRYFDAYEFLRHHKLYPELPTALIDDFFNISAIGRHSELMRHFETNICDYERSMKSACKVDCVDIGRHFLGKVEASYDFTVYYRIAISYGSSEMLKLMINKSRRYDVAELWEPILEAGRHVS